jgi:acetyl-CoA acetyltransferase
LPNETDSTTARHLRDKYAIVGVGETEYSRRSGRNQRSMAVEAVRNALDDAGLEPGEVDGMMSYQVMDSVMSDTLSGDLGMRLNFYMDCTGGGSNMSGWSSRAGARSSSTTRSCI